MPLGMHSFLCLDAILDCGKVTVFSVYFILLANTSLGVVARPEHCNQFGEDPDMNLIQVEYWRMDRPAKHLLA